MNRARSISVHRQKRLRVLHVSSGLGYGGVENTLGVLAQQRALCPEMEPSYALCFTGRLSDQLFAAGVEVHQLGEVRIRNPLSVWRARQALRRLLQRERFDRVVCHSAWTQAIFGPVVRSTGTRLIFWLHDPPGESLTWLERWAARSTPDFAVTNSRYTLERLWRFYRDVEGVAVYAPVEFAGVTLSESERQDVRAQFGVQDDTVVILQVGRWEPHKGHFLLLQALTKLGSDLRWTCWQVGSPNRPHEAEYRARVRHEAHELRLTDRIRFLGWQENVAKLFAAADIYCQPNSGPEPLGLTFVEAMDAGLPVITTAMGGPQETLDGSCAILTPPGDADALADALRHMIADGDFRRKLGAAGPARARSMYDPAVRIRYLHEVLTSCTPVSTE